MIQAIQNRASRPMSIFDYLNRDNPALQSQDYKNGTKDIQGKPIFKDAKGVKNYGYSSLRNFQQGQRAVGGPTTVQFATGPGTGLSSVGGWNYDGFGDGPQSEDGSIRDDSRNRIGMDRGGNIVDVGDRINARVGASSPTQGNSGGMGGGLNWLRERSPMAVMGRQMTPAQQMLGDPNDPYSQAAINQRDKQYGSLFPDDDPDPFED